jgi:virulence factor Mce-like protein
MSRLPRPRGRRLGPAPRLGLLAVALQIAAALVFVALLLRADGVHLPFTSAGDWRLVAQFDDAGGLRGETHAPVLVSGVPSGRVEDVRYAGGRAIVTLRLDGGARGIVKADARAAVEPRSALEDLTVDIDPGSASSPAARDGSRIGADRTRASVQLDRVVDVLDADTRSQLAILLDQLGAGLKDRPGALRDAVAKLAPMVDSATRISAALSERRALLVRLVGAVDRIASASGDHAAELEQAIAGARATLAVTARRDGDVRATLAELPPTLERLNGALAHTQALASPLNPALERLVPAAGELPGALAAVRRTAPVARALLADLDTLAKNGARPARQLGLTLRQLGPTVRSIRAPVRRLEPIMGAIDKHRDGVGALGEHFSGVLSTADANGTILRGLGFIEPIDPANFGLPGARGAQLVKLRSDLARALTHTCTTENAIACVVRYLVPGLPGAVRSLADGAEAGPR